MNCSVDRIQPLRLVKAACNRESSCIHRTKLSSQLRKYMEHDQLALWDGGGLLSWDSLKGTACLKVHTDAGFS